MPCRFIRDFLKRCRAGRTDRGDGVGQVERTVCGIGLDGCDGRHGALASPT